MRINDDLGYLDEVGARQLAEGQGSYRMATLAKAGSQRGHRSTRNSNIYKHICWRSGHNTAQFKHDLVVSAYNNINEHKYISLVIYQCYIYIYLIKMIDIDYISSLLYKSVELVETKIYTLYLILSGLINGTILIDIGYYFIQS